MRLNSVMMVGLAVVFGGLAVVTSQSWLSRQADAQKRLITEQNKAVSLSTIVVASAPLRFGSEISATNVREMPWPEDAVPAGAFISVSALLEEGGRVALSAVETNEPVLSAKITGPGQRATLSALIDQGMRAVTVRVNDVNGVAGFVLPGDRVDVLMTQKARDGTGLAAVILQGVRVLAVDQKADDREEAPDVVKAVTLEVETYAAQKIALAASIGELSLVLRRAGDNGAEETRSVTLGDLTPGMPVVAVAISGDEDETLPQPQPSPRTAIAPRLATVGVRGANGREEFRVPFDRTN